MAGGALRRRAAGADLCWPGACAGRAAGDVPHEAEASAAAAAEKGDQRPFPGARGRTLLPAASSRAGWRLRQATLGQLPSG